MKLKMYFLVLTLGLLGLSFQSCDDDDDRIKAPEALQWALTQRYPDAQRVEWETEGIYYVAEFIRNGYETEAWFTRDAVWQLTETDLPFTALPAAVRSAFQNSEYANWLVEDVDAIERPGTEVLYVIDVELGHQDVALHYSADGILVKVVTDGMGYPGYPDYPGGQGGNQGGQGGNQGYPGGGFLPPVQPDDAVMTAVRSYIEANYPGARIIEIDPYMNGIEVDIIHDNRSKDILFDADGTWISTSWDLFLSELPQAVLAAVRNAYPNYRIDGADYVESASRGTYYLVEVENGGRDLYLMVTAEGTILQ